MSTVYITRGYSYGTAQLPNCPKCGKPLFLTYKHGTGTGDPDVTYSVCAFCGAEKRITRVVED